jgi:hypothetical protein
MQKPKQKQNANTGVLHCVQDDDEKRGQLQQQTATATADPYWMTTKGQQRGDKRTAEVQAIAAISV